MTGVVPLVGHTWRALPARPLAEAVLLGSVVTALGVVVPAHVDPRGLTAIVRVAAGMAALGCAFLLDDPTERVLATTPVSLAIRRLVRVVLVSSLLTLWWVALLAVVRASVPDFVVQFVPLRDLTLEAAAMVALGTALGAVGTQVSAERLGGVFAAPAFLAAMAAVALLPERLSLFPAPLSAPWASAHRAWWVVLGAAVILFVVASRDPAAAGRPTLRPR